MSDFFTTTRVKIRINKCKTTTTISVVRSVLGVDKSSFTETTDLSMLKTHIMISRLTDLNRTKALKYNLTKLINFVAKEVDKKTGFVLAESILETNKTVEKNIPSTFALIYICTFDDIF